MNGLCFECYTVENDAWQKKMAIRQNPSQFNLDKLVRLLLTEHWMHECKIVPDYMPPFPSPDTRPTCRIQCTNEGGTTWSLRYSNGPLQGYFWDVYGEDFHSPEIALVAISQSPAPPGVKTVQTHGK